MSASNNVVPFIGNYLPKTNKFGDVLDILLTLVTRAPATTFSFYLIIRGYQIKCYILLSMFAVLIPTIFINVLNFIWSMFIQILQWVNKNSYSYHEIGNMPTLGSGPF